VLFVSLVISVVLLAVLSVPIVSIVSIIVVSFLETNVFSVELQAENTDNAITIMTDNVLFIFFTSKKFINVGKYIAFVI